MLVHILDYNCICTDASYYHLFALIITIVYIKKILACFGIKYTNTILF